MVEDGQCFVAEPKFFQAHPPKISLGLGWLNSKATGIIAVAQPRELFGGFRLPQALSSE